LKVAITAFGIALPSLAAAYWSIRIWYYTRESEPTAYGAHSRAHAEAMAGDRSKFWEVVSGTGQESRFLLVTAA
jgi:hypothetical protein